MLTLGVIFGGTGPEHEASLSSAHALLTQIDREKFSVQLFGIAKDGTWMTGPGAWNRLHAAADRKLLPSAIRNPDIKERSENSKCLTSFSPHDIFREVHCIFPLVHGLGGEDGALQGLLSFVSKPVAGCSLRASAQSYNKYTAKQLTRAAGIASAKAIHIPEWRSAEIAELVGDHFHGCWDLIVKPNACGSSFGVSKISSEADLPKAIELARTFDPEIVIEEYVNAVELFVGVMGRQPEITVAPPLIDAPYRKGVYTYFDKYISSRYKNARPDLSSHVERSAQDLACRIYDVLGCDSYARVDLFYTETGELLFNELNSPPALSPQSAFPLGMSLLKISYSELIERLVHNAIEGHSSAEKPRAMQIDWSSVEDSVLQDCNAA